MLARFLTRLLALPLLAVTLHAQADGLPPAVLQALKAGQVPAAGVAGVAEPEAILRTLKERYPGCRVILTLGKAGAAFLRDDGVMVPLPPCRPPTARR